jgi:hypothetical protein
MHRPLIVWIRLAAIGVLIAATIYGVWMHGWAALIVPAAGLMALAFGFVTFAIVVFAVWWIVEGVRRILRK